MRAHMSSSDPRPVMALLERVKVFSEHEGLMYTIKELTDHLANIREAMKDTIDGAIASQDPRHMQRLTKEETKYEGDEEVLERFNMLRSNYSVRDFPPPSPPASYLYYDYA